MASTSDSKQKSGMVSRGVCLLHENVRPHSAHVITALLEKFKWDILDHSPYSPDLAPSDFHLFLHLTKHLAGKNFDDNNEVQEEVMTWFKGQAADFYDSCIVYENVQFECRLPLLPFPKSISTKHNSRSFQ